MKKALFLQAIVLLFLTHAHGQQPKPTPADAPFLMAVEDVFYINGRGTIVTGKVERGRIKLGDTVDIVGIKPTRTTTVAAIEMFRKMVTEAETGTTVGILLKGIAKTDVERGQVLVKPGSMKAYTEVKATIDLLAAADGGRKTPISAGYRALIYFRHGAFSGVMTFPKGIDATLPGTKGVKVGIMLEKSAPLEKGQSFTFSEGGRSIGSGTVTAVIK